MTYKDFQMWLNAHGASLVVDGRGGPLSRWATLKTFTNRNAPAIQPQQMAAIAGRLGGTVQQLAAVAAVESSGGGFNEQGQPKALYERHYAFKRLKIKIPLLSDPTPGGYTIDADKDGINDSWEKIADMAMRDPIAAFESASFGKFQIMGAWANKLGYANAIEFAYSMVNGEAAHYEAVARYIERFDLVQAFRQLGPDPDKCRPFAKGYNGPKYEKYDYHNQLARQPYR